MTTLLTIEEKYLIECNKKIEEERDRYIARMKLLELRLDAIRYIQEGLLDSELKAIRPGGVIRLQVMDCSKGNYQFVNKRFVIGTPEQVGAAVRKGIDDVLPKPESNEPDIKPEKVGNTVRDTFRTP